MQKINVGAAENDGTGDTLRAAFTKLNGNLDYMQEVMDTFTPGEMTTGPWVDVRKYAGLAEALTAIGTDHKVLLCPVDVTVYANTTIPANVELYFMNGAKIGHGAYTISYLGSVARFPNAHIFNGTGAVTFGANVKEVLPVWLGAVDGAESSAAVQRAVATGKRVMIPHGSSYTAKNVTVTTANQAIIVNGTLKLPNACADNDAILKANAVNGVRVVGGGTLDGNKAGQSGAVSQQLVRLVGCNDSVVAGLTCKKNYSGATTAYAAVYMEGLRNKVRSLSLNDWSREGIWLNECSHSSVIDVTAIDADGDSWSAVQVGGATSKYNRIAHITAKNTGASAVGLDSLYSTMSDIVVDGVRYQHGVNLGHTGKPASYSTFSNVVVKNIMDDLNVGSAGVNIGGGTVHVTGNNIVVEGSTQRAVNVSDGSADIDLSNLKLKDCATAFAVYKSGRVSVKNLSLSGTVGTGISKDNGATSDYTTLILDTCDLTAATTKISGAAAGLLGEYIAYQSATFNSAEPADSGTAINGLGSGGSVTVTNANARATSRIILAPSNTAGAAAIPFVSAQNDGSFVITTVNSGGSGAYVRWRIV